MFSWWKYLLFSQMLSICWDAHIFWSFTISLWCLHSLIFQILNQWCIPGVNHICTQCIMYFIQVDSTWQYFVEDFWFYKTKILVYIVLWFSFGVRIVLFVKWIGECSLPILFSARVGEQLILISQSVWFTWEASRDEIFIVRFQNYNPIF